MGMIGNVVGNPRIMGEQRKLSVKKDQSVKKPLEVSSYTNLCDVTGCGHYRVIWPNFVLSSRYSNNKYAYGSNMMYDPNFFRGLTHFRVQRLVPDSHLEYLKHARKICDKYDIKIMYELDDIPLYEDIPIYNRHRSSYASPKLRQNIIDMMNMCDEITVSTKFMRDYFLDKIDNTNITYIPNCIPKFWMDRYFDEKKLKINFSKNKKKPRILYAGSASHYSKNGVIEDDFTKLEDFVKKTIKEFEWIFFGGIPRNLVPLLQAGKVKFIKGCGVIDYPEVFKSINANITIAPLVFNNFNRAKSNIKLIESGAYGIPCICQDNIETYSEDAIYTFNTPSELYDQIKTLTKDSNVYMKAARKSKAITDKYWLEDNIELWNELTKYPYGSDLRVNLNKLK